MVENFQRRAKAKERASRNKRKGPSSIPHWDESLTLTQMSPYQRLLMEAQGRVRPFAEKTLEELEKEAKGEILPPKMPLVRHRESQPPADPTQRMLREQLRRMRG